MWSNCCLYMVKAKYDQILYDQTQIHGQTKVMVIFPIYGQTCKICGQNSRKSPYIIVTDMTYLLVNWIDVTSTESAFANKIRDRAHKRTLTILTLCSLVHGPAPSGAESGDLALSLRYNPSFVGLARETRYNRTLYCMVLKQYGKHE